MKKTLIILGVSFGVIFLLAIWWRFFHIARPEVMPISIDPNDPLMLEAMQKAKESIPEFRRLVSKTVEGSHVKVPFLSSSGTKEYLWAEVLSLHDSEIDVRYVTPPVTHTGKLERLHTHSVTDLVDWTAPLPSGKIAGGYTMRVMFVRYRERDGKLPPELEAEESKYE